MPRFVPTFRLVVAGGGVAGLEACLAVQALARDRVALTLVAPDPSFVHRPATVPDPVAVRSARREPLDRFAAAVGAELHHDRLAAVDTKARRAVTAAGAELRYDGLLLAVGAVPLPVPPGAVPVGDRHDATALRGALTGLRQGAFASAAFVAPPAPAWRLELYELALQIAVGLRRDGIDARLTFVTAEESPLAILGPRASATLRQTLREHGIRVVESAYARAVGREGVELAPGDRRIGVDVVLAAPRLAGPAIPGLPHDAAGFLPIDTVGRVRDADGVYAAGDCADFPVKHASLAAQQADAAATVIAAAAGCDSTAVPFKPTVRCMLPARLRWYVDAPIAGGDGDAVRVSPEPLWPSTTRWGAQLLSAHLESDPGVPLSRSVAVENARRALRRLAAR
jgi:sulfide:quinone oxidoreductase